MKTDNFELFRAIGNADDRFIEEMLDGKTESLIKEKNKRRYVNRRLAFRSIAAAAAAAAVVFAAADLGILGGSDSGLIAEKSEQNAVVLDTQTETEDAEITEENAETADKSDEMTEAAEEKEIKEEFSTAVDGLPEENETQEKDVSENDSDSKMTGTVTTTGGDYSDYPDTNGITEADIASADNLVQAARYYGLDCESVVYSGGERSFSEEDFELLFGGEGAKSRAVSPEGIALETLTTEEFILLECTLDREDAPDEFTMKIYSTGLVCAYFDGEEYYFMFSPYGGKRVYDILLGE